MNVTAGTASLGETGTSATCSLSESHVPSQLRARDHRDSPEPPAGPQRPCFPPGCRLAPQPGLGVPFQMGRLTGPHPLSLARPRAQVHGGCRARCGSLSPGPRSAADARNTCSGARGHRSHPSHLMRHLFCQPGWHGRAQPAASSAAPAPPAPRAPARVNPESLFTVERGTSAAQSLCQGFQMETTARPRLQDQAGNCDGAVDY